MPGPRHDVDMVVNIGLLLLLGANNFVILYISNIGYVFCHVLRSSGFLLLRRDRPRWPRPIKVGGPWLAIAGVLALFNLVLVVYGVYDQDLASYIGFYEFTGLPLFLGIGVLIASVLMYFYRRVVEDKAKITFRDRDVPRCRTRSRWRCSVRRGSRFRAPRFPSPKGVGSAAPFRV